MIPKVYTAYLIGSIHHAKDRTKAFDAAEKAVVEAGHIALNPVKEEPIKTGMSCDDTENELGRLWREQKLEEYRILMDKIWEKDLENIRLADYLVLHFEIDDNSVGAPLEMTIASLSYLNKLMRSTCSESASTWLKMGKYCYEQAGYTHKPIYWVCQGPISDINTTLKWLVSTGSEVRVFKTYKELTEFLQKEYK